MDSLTHIVIGAAIGEAVLGKYIGKKAMFWGALANTIPDFDMVMNYIDEPVDALVAHRGFTHSLFFALIIPVKFMFLYRWFTKNKLVASYHWLLMFFLGFITHDLLDCMTAYGTGLFEPFNHKRIAFNNMFVIDPIITLPVLISTIALLILKRDSEKRRAWNALGLGLSALYILLTISIKQDVNKITENSLKNNKIQYSRYFTTPTAFNCFLWMTVAEGSDSFYVGYYSIFDTSKDIKLEVVPKNYHMAGELMGSEDLNKLTYFTDGYFCFAEENGKVFLNDLRFGRVSPWSEDKGPYVFQFGLFKDADNSFILEKGRWNSSSSFSDELKRLIKRIEGV